MDVGLCVISPGGVDFYVGLDVANFTVGVISVNVAESGDGGLGVELSDVGDVVGVGVRGFAGAAGRVDDDGEVDGRIGRDGCEEGAPGAGGGCVSGGIDVEGEDD